MNIESKIKVSVVLAHYNREEIILETLNSLSNQTFKDFECLIIDDQSTDNSPAIIKDFCRKDSRFKYIRNDYNSGKCFSFNFGIERSKGEFIVFVDNDDIFNPHYLMKLYESISSSNADMAVCNYNIWYCDSGEIIKSTLHQDAVNGGLKKKVSYISKEWYLMFPPQVWTKIFRRSIITDNGIVFENVAREGNLFIHKYLYFCSSVAVISEELVDYRLYSDMSKHGSGGDYYLRSDMLYKALEFRNKFITHKLKQRAAWDLYMVKFIVDICEARGSHSKHGNDDIITLIKTLKPSYAVKYFSPAIWSKYRSLLNKLGLSKIDAINYHGGYVFLYGLVFKLKQAVGSLKCC